MSFWEDVQTTTVTMVSEGQGRARIQALTVWPQSPSYLVPTASGQALGLGTMTEEDMLG
jgi:hypothetical protein